MIRALHTYLQHVGRHGDHDQAVLAAAKAVASDPWAVVHEAGLLARCRMAVADRVCGLRQDLRLTRPDDPRSVATLSVGMPFPALDAKGRRRRGAFDTPRAMARRVVQETLKATSGPVSEAMDPACGPGAFLVALCEQGIRTVRGTDLDRLAVSVARIAAPRAHVEVANAFEESSTVDVVVGNPPYVPPERQDKVLRNALRTRLPWLRGRFDLVVPFAAIAAQRVRPRGGVGLVLPAASMVQPYGAPLRRQWVSSHRIAVLSGPHPFPGAAVDVVLLILEAGAGPAALPDHQISATEVLRLENVPLNARLHPGDVDIVERVRAEAVPLGDLCVVDTGVVAHGPKGGKARLLTDTPGPGCVPYADARDFFAGRHRWLRYVPEEMHRAKRPRLFEEPKIVVQRLRGNKPIRARIDLQGIYVGHTCTIVQPKREDCPPLERLLTLIRSPLVDAITRIERGHRLDLYPRDVAGIPVPRIWLERPTCPLEEAFVLGRSGHARLRAIASGEG